MLDEDKDTTMSLRIKVKDKEKLTQIAKLNERSLSQLVRLIIQDYLKDK